MSNGKLKGVKRWPLEFYRPIGTTDSEHAFCWMLDEIRRRHPEPPRNERTLLRLVGRLAERLHRAGSFNMMLCDSRYLYCYCSTHLAWLTRRAPFGEASLIDRELTVDFARETTPRDVVTVIATRPLTHGETWEIMAPGQMAVFRQGLPVA